MDRENCSSCRRLMLVKCSEMWIAIERLKQGESINVQDLKTNLYWEFRKFTSRDGESLESYYSRFYKMMNELVKNQNDCYNHQVNVSSYFNYNQNGKAKECQKPKRAKDAAYHKEKMLLYKQEEAGFQFNADQADWRDDTDDEPDDQELEAHYMYMAQLQEVTPDVADNFRPIFNSEPLQEVQNDDDHYNVIANNGEHPVQPKSVNDTYLEEQGDTNITIDSLDMSTNGETVDQDDDDLANERDLLATLIDKLNVKLMTTKTKEREQYFEIQELKAQLQDRNIALCELKKLYEKLKGKFVETKFENSSVIRQPNAFKSQRQSVLGKPATFSDSLAKKDFSKKDLSKPVTTQILPQNLIEIILFIVDSGCSKHMTGNLKLLTNFMEKFPGTVKFRNDQIAPILGYGDLIQGKITIKRVYYVEGLNHNLFSVGQLCDADLEVAFRKSTCYIHDLKGNDLLTGSRGSDLYSITLQDTSTLNPICLMAKAISSQAWLWHRRLSHLNFDTINLLSKNDIVIGLPKLKFIKDHLCSSCEYTWTHLLRSKDETPEVLIDFLTFVQRGLHAQVRTVRTDKGMEFLNKTLHAYFAKEGIRHETSTTRTLEQNGVVERQNHTLVEVARTMLSAAKVSLYNYNNIYGENLNKMKEKGDACIFVGYSTQSRVYRMLSSDPVPQCPTTELEHDSLTPIPQSQENVPHAAETVTMSNELDFLFSLMFDELLYRTAIVVSKSSAVNAADAPNKCQQQNTTQSTTITVAADIPPLNIQHHQKLQSSTHQH
ncbi:retrovirus-related pol polyprotein from transposon TNT 1-94 [Tanacetum coccineum]